MLDKLPKIETHEHDPIEAAERIIAGMPNPPEIQHAGSKAFYSPITDRITLPPRELFVSAEEYYATALHETVHSTGQSEAPCARRRSAKPPRSVRARLLKRRTVSRKWEPPIFARKPESQTQSFENQAAYVAGWLKKLRDDRKLLIHAAAQAQKAADYILRAQHTDPNA